MKAPAFTQRQVNIALTGITLVGVVIAVLVYLDNKKHEKIKEDTLRLDKEIKTLELALKQYEAKKTGVA